MKLSEGERREKKKHRLVDGVLAGFTGMELLTILTSELNLLL
jgi:hypothetical protein